MDLIYEKNFDYKAKLEELDVPDESPFRNDVLYRKSDAKRLTKIVLSYHRGAVIALDSPWGTGKTTFVNMWMKSLKREQFPVIYYNAWEDDISDEPLVSMLQQLRTLDKSDGLDELFKLGAKVVIGALAEGLTELSPFGKFFKGMFKGGVKQVEKQLYDKMSKEDGKSQLIREFKEKLSDYIEKACGLDQIEKSNDTIKEGLEKTLNQYGTYGEPPIKPLVYIIDELDRCNPFFAVKVLERIKHLFEVPNVVFILAIDKQQFSYSINGYYGSDKIDSMEYLRRFIDFDVKLSEPSHIDYFAHLFHYFNLNTFLGIKDASDDNYDFSCFVRLLRYNHITLRKAERILSLLSAVYVQYGDSFVMDLKGRYDLCFFMAYLKLCYTSLYDEIKSLKLGLQDICNQLEDVFPNSFANDRESEFYSNLLIKALFLYSIDLHIIDNYTTDKSYINQELFYFKQTNTYAPDKLTVNIYEDIWKMELNKCKTSIQKLSFHKAEYKDFDIEDYIVKDAYQMSLLSIMTAFDLIGSPNTNIMLYNKETYTKILKKHQIPRDEETSANE